MLRQIILLTIGGYILKNASTEDLLNAIRLTYKGMTIISPEVADTLDKTPSETILTPRQLEVLQLMVWGLNNTQIGGALNISPYTARYHVSQILGKLGASNRTAAISMALHQKLVDCEDL